MSPNEVKARLERLSRMHSGSMINNSHAPHIAETAREALKYLKQLEDQAVIDSWARNPDRMGS